MCLLDRWGIGVSQVIGVGGRDLVWPWWAGRWRQAVRAPDADPGTELYLLVSTPAPRGGPGGNGASRATPVVAACLGMSAPDGRIGAALLADTLEHGSMN